MRSIFFSLLLLAMIPCAGAAQLRDLRVWDGPESTRVVLDLSAGVEHKVFTLANPDRIVIDISGLDKASMARVERAEAKGLVKKLRGGPRDDGSLRIVLDVAEPVTPKSFLLGPTEQYGDRLIVDLYGHTPTLEELADAKLAPTVQFNTRKNPVRPGSPTTRTIERPIVVAVDAGHGGEDPGALGRSGLREKDAALAMARRLANLINEQPGMKAVLTRDGDYFIGLRERTIKARQAQADMFVSIHCNAYKDRAARGSAVYVLSDRGATNEHARWLAHKENSADMVGGLGLGDKDNELAAVLIDLSQASSMEASFDVGGRVLTSLARINPLNKAEVQQAGFMVLKSPDMPSLLVETAFITNDQDEKLLASSAYHEKIAQSVLEGIQGYFRSYRPHPPVIEERPRLQKVRQDEAGRAREAVSE